MVGTVLCMGAQGRYRGPSGVRDRDWLFWIVVGPAWLLAGLLAVVGVVGGLVGEAFRSINSDGVLGYVPPSGGWVLGGMAGGVIAAVAAVVVAGAIRPRWVAALAAWGIVVLQAGWLVLADRMAFFQGI